ncbi:hypothetical protein [Crocosphaera sp.]|uniref:hypothetical protein n=1 Tax=Crocosphaera sp. TaxID=2729996 RepID=UPI00263795B3|nr:hypothetical protein [Crocosphaera sp.]MDJ0582515.1 hypothetical protein [Crocosphaera sp.]
MKTQSEVIKKGYQALIDSLGVVDTLCFIQYLKSGEGDYTKERHQWLENQSVDDIFKEIRQLPQDDLNEYNEIIK